MRALAFSVLLAVNLGGGFGDATAEIVSVSGETMIVSLEVEVEVGANSVVAHLIAPGESQLTVPLISRGEGVFGVQTEMRSIDYRVVFEALGDSNAQSREVSLTEMGAEFPTDSSAPAATTVPLEEPRESSQWGWLALALAAASLSALAFWVLGGSSRGEEQDGDTNDAGSQGPQGDS